MDKKIGLKWVFALLVIATFSFIGCEKEERNIIETDNPEPVDTISSVVSPVNINEKGFEFLDQMQGHWVGTNLVIADNYDWFGFDYRPISPSHIQGIFEGGTFGNLSTSFFIANFKGTRTIMARNGGVLNGIYRTSYFVMDEVEKREDGSDFYRFVDAHGGEKTMSLELRFIQDSLYFNAYTSRLGQNIPSRHMTFKGKKEHLELTQYAAAEVGFPQNVEEFDFSNGFIEEFLQASPGGKSATFLAQDETGTKDIFTLAQESGDPYTIDQHPYLGYLYLEIERTPEMEDKSLILNISKDPLTDEFGYFTVGLDAFNTVLWFSSLDANEKEFLYTYIHPGTYYINVTADMNEDGFISEGDITHPLRSITIDPEGQHEIKITELNIQN